MRVKLTKRVVEAAEAPARGDLWLRDSERPGLRLRVWRGWAKRVRRAYVVSWADGRGRQPQITLGDHGAPWRPDPETGEPRTLTLDAARVEAARLLGLVAAGRDPREEREGARGGRVPTLREFAPRYLADWAKVEKAPRSVAEDEGNLERHLLPLLGDLQLDVIGPEHVSRLKATLAAVPTTANRCRALLSKMVNTAVLWRILPRDHPNPCRDVPKFREKGRTRRLTVDELAVIGGALEEEAKGAAVAVAALRVLAFTAARPVEILGLLRAQLPGIVAHGVVVAVSRKAAEGSRPIPFPPPARDAAAGAPAVDGNPFLFPGEVEGRPLTIWGLEGAWERVRLRASGWRREEGRWQPPAERAAVDVRDVRVYDLRHTLGTILAEDGAEAFLIQAVLGHSDPRTSQKYVHVGAGPAGAVAAAAAAKVEEAMRRRG